MNIILTEIVRSTQNHNQQRTPKPTTKSTSSWRAGEEEEYILEIYSNFKSW